jgi:glycerol-3-phosphate acyltransferase PlsY
VTGGEVLLLGAAAVVGYLVGSLSPAALFARRIGLDLHKVGSGNVGATNAGRAMGARVGITVALLDVVKGAVPAAAFGAVDHRAGLLAGFAAVVGHVTSPWLRGRGGRGVATAMGAILGSHPIWAPAVLVTWLLVVVVARWVTLASICGAAALVVVAVASRASAPSTAWAVGIAVVVWWRHRRNVVSWVAARRGRTAA